MLYYESPGSVLSIAIVLPLVNILFVALRFSVRKQQKQPLLADDWLTTPALALNIGIGAALLAGFVLREIGHRTPEFRPRGLLPRTNLLDANHQIAVTSQVEWAIVIMSTPALGLIKLSVLFFYRRIFCPSRDTIFSKITMGMILLVTGWTMAFFFSSLFACRGHFSSWWGSVVSLRQHCVNMFLMSFVLIILDFVMDFIIVLLPIPMIWTLHVSRQRKVAVSAVFLLGLVAVAASLTRLVINAQEYKARFDPKVDEDLEITGHLYFTFLECGLGLIAACLPTLKPLFQKLSETRSISLRSLIPLLYTPKSGAAEISDEDHFRKMPSRGSISSRSRIICESRSGEREDVEQFALQQNS